MDEMEATKLWVQREFANIPTPLVKRAFRDNFEELELLSENYPELDYPCGWGWMFHPENRLDEEWILEHIQEVEACGFLVYDSDETGILLGVDGCGYDFYEHHWLPLYKRRGLEWHEVLKEGGGER